MSPTGTGSRSGSSPTCSTCRGRGSPRSSQSSPNSTETERDRSAPAAALSGDRKGGPEEGGGPWKVGPIRHAEASDSNLADSGRPARDASELARHALAVGVRLHGGEDRLPQGLPRARHP